MHFTYYYIIIIFILNKYDLTIKFFAKRWSCLIIIINNYYHYKKKVFRWQFFTIKVVYIYQGMLLFIYVIYASVKKSLNLPWRLHMSRFFIFLPMIKSLLLWHMSMFLSLLSRFSDWNTIFPNSKSNLHY